MTRSILKNDTANRLSILGINRPVLDARHNDDHPAFQQCQCRGRKGEGGGGKESSTIYRILVKLARGRVTVTR